MILVIAVLLLIIWIVPVNLIIAGITCLITANVSGGANNKQYTTLTKVNPYFTKPIAIAKADTKWLTGNLTPDIPEAPYIYQETVYPPIKITGLDIKKIVRRPLHWGQRKLLLTEIDFLSTPELKNQIVVYAGAADGRHIVFLSELFPKTEFHLYDPRPFYKQCYNHPRIHINPFYEGKPKTDTTNFFTDEVAGWYTGKPVWFVSDIRTQPKEPDILENQAAQQGWVHIMKPERSMLKFKMPYPVEGNSITYTYLDGEIRMQCWPPIYSAETRLIVEGVPKKNREWDILKYERQCSWFNTIQRLGDFGAVNLRLVGVASDETVDEFWNQYAPNIQHGSDFVYELQILTKYIQQQSAIYQDLHILVQKINRSLLGPQENFIRRLHHK